MMMCTICNAQDSPSEIYAKILTGSVSGYEEFITLNGQNYLINIVIEDLHFLTQIIRKKWILIQNIILLNDTNTNYKQLVEARTDINNILKAICINLYTVRNTDFESDYCKSVLEFLEKTRSLIVPFDQLKTQSISNLFLFNTLDEKCTVHYYFHTYLEVQFYHLILLKFCHKIDDNNLRILLKNLVLIAEKTNDTKGTSFLCDCVKNLWMIITLFADTNFWSIFNDLVENKEPTFTICLLKDITVLQSNNHQKIQSNFVLLDHLLKTILTSPETNNLQLSKCLQSLQVLLCDVWLTDVKIDVYQMLWEHFARRLNVIFTSPICSASKFIDLVDGIISGPKAPLHGGDFECFLSMLCCHLRQHGSHWARFKGRIYSLLNPNKIKELTSAEGIVRVAVMYSALGSVIGEDEALKRFCALVENLPHPKKFTSSVWSSCIGFMARLTRSGRDCQKLAYVIVTMLEHVAQDRHLYHLIKTFLPDLELLFKLSSNLQLNQLILVNSQWIHKYMVSCEYSQLTQLIGILIDVLRRVDNEGIWPDWEQCFRHHIYPTLKLVCSCTAPEGGGALAANIVHLCPSIMPEAFAFFNGDGMSVKISAEFIAEFLNNHPMTFVMTKQYEIIAVQTWIRYNFLRKTGPDKLIEQILHLECLQTVQFDRQRLLMDPEPFCAFISALSENTDSADTKKLLEICFGCCDRWICSYLAQPDDELIVQRIYSYFGQIFMKIGSLLYNRHRQNSPLTKLIACLLLSTDQMTGKTLHPFILNAIRQNWQVYFESLQDLTTSTTTIDTFLDRVVRDLIIKYVPHFALIQSPIVRSMQNDRNAPIILNRLSTSFFKQLSTESDGNTFKAIRLVHQFVCTNSDSSLDLMRIVVNNTLFGLFEVILFQAQRETAFNTIKSIIQSKFYPDHLSDEFRQVIGLILDRHLSFNVNSCFMLLESLTKLIPKDILYLLPQIKEKIIEVERKRGVGFDTILRRHLDKLQTILNKFE